MDIQVGAACTMSAVVQFVSTLRSASFSNYLFSAKHLPIANNDTFFAC